MEHKQPTKTLSTKTFRFKFSETMCDLLLDFSQQHKFDSKTDFKENWDAWTKEYQDEICDEKTRLESLGYDGDINDKMYKSVRYYYCKRVTPSDCEIHKKRRKYLSKNKEFIDTIDDFIRRQCHDAGNDRITCDLKPSDGWTLFCEMYTEDIENELARITEEDTSLSIEDALKKTQKTFNNRYYINVRNERLLKQ